MNIEHDKQVGCAVALVLAVVTRCKSRGGRRGCTDFADELLRAFIKTDHRMLSIGAVLCSQIDIDPN